MTKRKINLLVCNKFIYNLSITVTLILHFSSEETRKYFYDLIMKNNEDLMLIYLICSASSNEFNFSKFFSNEQLFSITEKFTKELEKQVNLFENLINDVKKQKNQTIILKLKQNFNTISLVGKIIDCFLIRGNRTYNYSKIICNLLKYMKNLWDLLLITPEIQVILSIIFLGN